MRGDSCGHAGGACLGHVPPLFRSLRLCNLLGATGKVGLLFALRVFGACGAGRARERRSGQV